MSVCGPFSRENLSEDTLKLLSGQDLEFFDRVWKTNLDVYEKRLKAIGFFGADRLLDAGCGFGQWSVALSFLNRDVWCFDNHPGRISSIKEILKLKRIQNVYPSVKSIVKTDYTDNFFDLVFCYGVIMFSDFRKSVRELHRVLKPGGRLYICTNGVGWYFYNLIETHNSSQNFDSRLMAMETFEATLQYLYTGVYPEGKQIIVPSEIMKRELEIAGFELIAKGAEGTINFTDQPITPFFKGVYHNREGVYEILAQKRV
ncbi:MAG: class I SAM-dependent methyltransferase [Flavobacteriales bacterium]|nr:class I SAM-dependent methyltransferase [Flavobacteriales bacterium]